MTEIIKSFLFILAFLTAILSTFMAIATTIAAMNYSDSLQEAIDGSQGFRRNYRPLPYIMVAVISWAWIAGNILSYVDKLDLF
jgi:hypothetical protein